MVMSMDARRVKKSKYKINGSVSRPTNSIRAPTPLSRTATATFHSIYSFICSPQSPFFHSGFYWRCAWWVCGLRKNLKGKENGFSFQFKFAAVWAQCASFNKLVLIGIDSLRSCDYKMCAPSERKHMKGGSIFRPQKTTMDKNMGMGSIAYYTYNDQRNSVSVCAQNEFYACCSTITPNCLAFSPRLVWLFRAGAISSEL